MKKKKDYDDLRDIGEEELRRQGYPSDSISLLSAMGEHLLNDKILELHLANYVHKCFVYEKRIKELENYINQLSKNNKAEKEIQQC